MATPLNPNAPIFVPWTYRAVEDFSEQWWDLIQSSPYFRDYWSQEYCFPDHHDQDPHFDFDTTLSQSQDEDGDDIVAHNSSNISSIQQERGRRMDLISLGLLKWRKPRGPVEIAKYGEKAPKIVNVRVSPRPIKQPR